MNYAFNHQGKSYTSAGGVTMELSAEQTAEYNRSLESQELAWLRTGPDKVFLYVRHAGWTDIHGTPMQHAKGFGDYWSHSCQIITFLGTVVCDRAWIGSETRDNFGGTRAAIDCRIFGVRYVGWYFSSSGDYCRLRRAKQQK